MGIETSYDDTGVAIVDGNGHVLADGVRSQNHVRFGGVNPPLAEKLHRRDLDPLASEVLAAAGLQPKQLTAVAVTTRPGMSLSLRIGCSWALQFARLHSKPLVSVHHMAAHALVARLEHRHLQFPFLCMLLSGGHSLLLWVEDVHRFKVLGSSIDVAVGECIDKVARRLKLHHLDEQCEMMSGGALMERVAAAGSALAIPFNAVFAEQSCNFSFVGLQSQAFQMIKKREEQLQLVGSFIPDLADFCASFQHAVFRHLAKRLQRAFEFLHSKGWPAHSFVLSGGVACNGYFRSQLALVAAHYNCETVCPSVELCSDNGIMIAWTGLEWFRRDIHVIHELPDELSIEPRQPLGPDLSEEIKSQHIKILNNLKLDRLNQQQCNQLDLNNK